MLRSFVLFAAVVLAGGSVEQGTPGRSFSTTLTSVKITARPGQVVTRQFRLTLDANQPKARFKARVEDWWRSEDGKSTYAPAGTLRRSCANWTSINPVESEVEAEGTLVIRVTATIPAELRAGGYWCALTIDEVPDPLAPQSGVGVRFVASVSTGIFIYIDPVERAGSIVDLQINADQAIVKVTNEGNAPLGIEGRVEFFVRGATTPVAVVTFARTTVLTEPTPNALMGVALPPIDVLPSGKYVVRTILDIGADHDIGAEREIDIQRGRAGAGSGPIR